MKIFSIFLPGEGVCWFVNFQIVVELVRLGSAVVEILIVLRLGRLSSSLQIVSFLCFWLFGDSSGLVFQ